MNGTAAVALACILGAATADTVAARDLGAAGPFRELGGAICGLGPAAQFAGACDPPRVADDIPPKDRAALHVARALALLDLLRTDEARRDLDAAILADPANGTAYRLRARLALGSGNSTLVEGDLNAALALVPGDPDLLATRAFLRGDLDDANASIAARPSNPDALWIRAVVLSRHGNRLGAVRDLDAALILEPDHRRARAMRAEINLALGRLREAGQDATDILERAPGDRAARQVRASARKLAGDREGALADLDAALGPLSSTLNLPAFREMALQRAMLLLELGRSEAGLEDIGRVLDQGGHPAVLRVQIYLRQNGFPELRLDGERSSALAAAVERCFRSAECVKGLRL